MGTNDRLTQENSPATESTARRPWLAPRVADHGSLRWFVRASSGAFDDGHTGTAGGGGTMDSKLKQT
jgi:hypothetical protein